MNLTAGSRLGSYEILGLLGAGGMGQVFRARDLQLGREVAIKILAEDAAKDEERIRRFTAEAKAASALNHPNILTVYGIGEEENHPYLVTELVDGTTLRTKLRNGPLGVDTAIDIILQVLAGLSKAHAAGIVHRDLKPENLMITRDGLVKILDFGLVKLLKGHVADSPGQLQTLGVSDTQTGFIAGTAAYMSPEQARGQQVDFRSDLFSLAVIFYEMLTGKNPFQRSTAVDTISAILRDQPEAISESVLFAPAELSSILEKALAKNPEDRFASTKEFEIRLRNVAKGFQDQANLPTTDYVAQASREFPTQSAQTLRIPARIWKSSWAILPIVLIPLLLVIFGFNPFSSKQVTVPAGPPVVAVMAIDNNTSDQELAQADVGRILADAFLQILYDCEGVKIVSPLRIHSIVSGLKRSYADTAKDLDLVQEICKLSNANTVLSGSLSQLGDTYILDGTLTQLPDHLLVSFRAESKGKTHLLENITASIAPNLKKTLGQKAGVNIAGGRKIGEVATDSFSAYTHFVKGLDLNNEGKWPAAAGELNRALQIDPAMGLAWSELACAYSFGGDEAKARAAQRKAMELRSRMTRKEQLWVDANSLWFTGNGENYRKKMQEFAKEFPDDRMGYFYTGLSWQWLSRNPKEAILWYEKAYTLSPEYYPVTKTLVDCYLELNQKDQAVAALQRYLKNVTAGYGHQQAQARLTKIAPV